MPDIPSTALALKDTQNPELAPARFREATDIANICREIVLKRSKEIGDRQYVQVEGWTSIAVAHGCMATIREGSVQEIFGADGKVIGTKAYAEVVRQLDGKVLSGAEGFVGADEPLWYGGEDFWYNRDTQKEEVYIRRKRPAFAIRAMAQTRGISRACRTAFSHVVVLMNAGLSTTPAEEMGVDDDEINPLIASNGPAKHTEKPVDKEEPEKKAEIPVGELADLEKQFESGRWEKVKVHFAQNAGRPLAELPNEIILWYAFKWNGSMKGKPPSQDDKILRAACNVAVRERGLKNPDATNG